MTNAERVQLGANLLDERVPGWVTRVNLYTLDIASALDCVLGQAYSTDVSRYNAYDGALETLFGLDTALDEKAVEHGFEMTGVVTGGPAGPGYPSFDAERDELNNLWREAIQARLPQQPN
jgi:hypothetical protein